MAEPNEYQIGDTREVQQPSGRIVLYEWDGDDWVIKQTYDPRREPRGPSLSPNTSAQLDWAKEKYGLDEAALAAREALEQERDALNRAEREEQRQYNRQRQQMLDEEQKVEQAVARAERDRNYNESKRWKEIGQGWTERKDSLDRAWEDKKFQYDEKQSALNRTERKQAFEYKQAGDALEREFRTGQALGEIGGRPTLEGRRTALEEQRYQDELANQPQNFFNYTFRSRGQEPPALPSRPAPVAGQPIAGPAPAPAPAAPIAGQPAPWPPTTAPYQSSAAQRDLSAAANMSNEAILGTYSAMELIGLPLDIAAKLPNEALLEIGRHYPGGVDAYLKLFPAERVQGSGQWGGTGFGLDVQERVLGGAGAPAATATPTGRSRLGGGGPIITEPLSLESAPDITRRVGTGPYQTIEQPVSGLAGQPIGTGAPSVEDAMALAEQIRRGG